MSFYHGRHAELYDLFYANKPYADEAAFVHQCVQQHSLGATQRILELACGTGEHAFRFEQLGYDVLATDASEDMLACARRKARQRASAVSFRLADMRALALPEPPFDAVLCLFDSIGYVATNDALRNVLQGVRRALRPNGLFLFEFWHAGAMLRSYDPVRIRRWHTPTGEILRIAETELDCAQQLGSVTYTIYEFSPNGTYHSLTETQRNRFFLVQEMAEWLRNAGFIPLVWHNGFTPQTDITVETWHVIGIARKSADVADRHTEGM